jgi:hypothetical protein
MATPASEDRMPPAVLPPYSLLLHVRLFRPPRFFGAQGDLA